MVFNDLGQTKIGQLDYKWFLTRDQDIIRLDIPVSNVTLVKIIKRLAYLSSHSLTQELCHDSLVDVEILSEVSHWNEFHNYVEISVKILMIGVADNMGLWGEHIRFE